METKDSMGERILVIILKEPFVAHTVTSLAQALNKTRQGIWKMLTKLKENNLIILKPIGNTKKSAVIVKLNLDNPLLEKTLSLLLAKEALKQRRWMVNFAAFEESVNFLILFGSILVNPHEANDIDILAILNRRNFKAVDEKLLKIQVTQLKKIHLIDLTEGEFKNELKRPNKAYLDALKKGVILYGQENFIKFIKTLEK